MNDLDEMAESYYEDEAEIGSLVTLRSVHYETSVTGEVVGLLRKDGLRVSGADLDYDYVLFSNYQIKLAGIKQWFPIVANEEELVGKWRLIVSTTDLSAKKLKTTFRKESE
jgi:hypothetical protein